MLVGYARTSTIEQSSSLHTQNLELLKVGCEKIFEEQVSSVDVTARIRLAEAIDFVREGDTFVVTRLDRLARSVPHLLELLEELKRKGTDLRILAMGIDTSTATGKLMLTLLGGIAEFEREIMLERQREGIARAKALGKYKGRSPTARAHSNEVLELHREGKGATEVARATGISRASVYRILNEAETKRSKAERVKS